MAAENNNNSLGSCGSKRILMCMFGVVDMFGLCVVCICLSDA
jgi:hypothetical protein